MLVTVWQLLLIDFSFEIQAINKLFRELEMLTIYILLDQRWEFSCDLRPSSSPLHKEVPEAKDWLTDMLHHCNDQHPILVKIIAFGFIPNHSQPYLCCVFYTVLHSAMIDIECVCGWLCATLGLNLIERWQVTAIAKHLRRKQRRRWEIIFIFCASILYCSFFLDIFQSLLF